MLTGPSAGGSNVAAIISHIFPPQPGLGVTSSGVDWFKTLTLFVTMSNHKTGMLIVYKDAQSRSWKCTSLHGECPSLKG